MIVVEGPDGAGKTRLAQSLADDLHAPLMAKAVGGDTNDLMPVPRWIEASLDMGYSTRVYDRHALISEPIYMGAMVGSNRYTPREPFADYAKISTIYSRWRDLAPLVIICLPPLDEVWKNCQRDEANKRLFPNKYKVAQVYWLYFNLAARNPAYFLYDYTKDDYGMLLEFVEASLEARR